MTLKTTTPLIVGNGEITGKKDAIDSFNFVVRLNQFKLAGYENDVGTKLNAVAAQWKFCGTEIGKAAQVWWVQSSDWCKSSSDWWSSYAKTRVKLNVFMEDNPAFKLIVESEKLAIKFGIESKGQQPWHEGIALSTGYATILFMLQLYSRVAIIGFDFGQTGHYYNKDWKHWSGHDWDYKRKAVETLIASGKVVQVL